MGWIGSLAGCYLGSHFGGWFGALLGSVAGHYIQERYFRTGRPGGGRRTVSTEGLSMVFCASAAAMLAKMAKADGQVSRSEIVGVERAFARLGFSASVREYAIGVFRKAKDDEHTIYDYAREFAREVRSLEVRELFYEMLWDVACADGVVSSAELEMLQRVPYDLRIRPGWFNYFASARLRSGPGGGHGGGGPAPRDELADAYRLLGASERDSASELKRKYRELAKKNHPDALRAQGLPEEMVGKATDRMSRINAAWERIRTARGI